MQGYSKLVIVGNGFDLYCNLPTSLADFRNYFLKRVNEKMMELDIQKIWGKCPFEITYPHSLSNPQLKFWMDYEQSLAQINRNTLRELNIEKQKECLESTYTLANVLFQEWICSVDQQCYSSKKGNVSDDAFFITFNYTHTLQYFFGAKDEQIYHIHGNTSSPEQIKVGHNKGKRTKPKPDVYDHSIVGQRNYIIDSYLYKTDKKSNNIKSTLTKKDVGKLTSASKNNILLKKQKEIIDFRQLREIIIIGHSMNEIDKTYFTYFHNKTKNFSPFWKIFTFNGDDVARADKLLKHLQIPHQNFALLEYCDITAQDAINFA